MNELQRRRLVWTGGGLMAVAIGILLSMSRGLAATSVPLWASVSLVAGAMFVVQRFPMHLVTARGRLNVTLVEPLLMIGLFTVEPFALILGCLLGTIPAILMIRPEPIKFAVGIVQSGLWVALPAVIFHRSTTLGPTFEPRQLWIAWSLAVLAWVGSALTIRIPIGLITGSGHEPTKEARQLLAAAVSGIGAASLALVGLALFDRSITLVGLLAIPIVQLVLSVTEQRRSSETERVLNVTAEIADALRNAPTVAEILGPALPVLADAYDADEVLLLLTGAGRVVRQAANDSSGRATRDLETFPSETELRNWLDAHDRDGPSVVKTPELDALAKGLGVKEILVVPIVARGGSSAIVFAGRRLGPFRREHVELSRGLALAASTRIDQQHLSNALHEAGRRESELERRASHDTLTGLANRNVFEHQATAALGSGRSVAVLFMDLNDFKAINDEHGHLAGDAVLVATATRLQQCVRPSDVVARVGGDEFAILILDGGLSIAIEIGERAIEALAQPVESVPSVLAIGAAIGAAEAEIGETLTSLMERADTAMYRAKRSPESPPRVALG